ncbi:uncharacterized protein LOC123008457 [Tribolium madens]|uniref:uncharacterized protein LOC123008456 n=1 Tax=Tribolium madens TaxID=41895 RepID=UPI001CF76687|nr:uncharacterized protein LOC123008456 [Tribolium madens]XP_044260187.1 uncharacterized protein LOC123008457 [Tribolium madens]
MLRFVSFLCLFLLVQGEVLEMFNPSSLQNCMKKLSIGEDEWAQVLQDKPEVPPEKILCLFKCAMEDDGLLKDGVLDKSKWPMPDCVQNVGTISNCTDMVAFKDCFN